MGNASRLLVPNDEAGNSVGDALLEHVKPLLRSGDVAEALGWIETGRRLLSVAHGSFDTSLLVANRLVELEQRRADDRRLLKRFLPRDEQVAAFKQLLEVQMARSPGVALPWARRCRQDDDATAHRRSAGPRGRPDRRPH